MELLARHDPVNLVTKYRKNLESLRGIYIDCGCRDQFHIHYGSRISTMPSPAIPVAAIAAKTETPIATMPPTNFARAFNIGTSCRSPSGRRLFLGRESG